MADVEGLDLERDPGLGRALDDPRPAGGGVMKVSSPKFIEPDSTPEMSGFASRPVVRSSIVMSLAPPVETIVSSSEPARIRSITSRNSSGRPLGVPSSSRTCRWTTVAPASLASMLESAISSVVYGMFGLFSRKTSAPVTATVTTTGLLFHAHRGLLLPSPPARPAPRR